MGLYRLVALISGWQLVASVCYYAVFAATPFLRDRYDLTGAEVGLAVTALTLGYAAFLLPIGVLTDRHGERRTLTIGLLTLSGGAVLVARAGSYPALLASVFLLGSAYGTAMPGTNKAILEGVPVARRNLILGIKQVGVTAGSGTSALLVTGIAGVLFWEAGFYVAAGAGLVTAVAFWVAYRGSQGSGGGGDAGYAGFRGLFENGPYLSLTAAGVCLGAGLFTTTGYTIIYVDESIGASVAFGGIVLAALQASGSLGRIATGWVSDVLPGTPRRVTGGVLLGQALASALLFVAVAFTRLPATAALTFVLLGFFILGCTGVYYSCMATLVSPEAIGGATAGGQLALTAGGLFAPPLFGYLSDTVGYRAGWYTLAALAVAAAAFVAHVVRTEPPVDRVAATERVDPEA